MINNKTTIQKHYIIDDSGCEKLVGKDVITETACFAMGDDCEDCYDEECSFSDSCELEQKSDFLPITLWALLVATVGTVAGTVIVSIFSSL